MKLQLIDYAVIALYVAFVLASTAALAVRHGVTLAPRIAAALVAVHLGYGIGFWKGLLAFGVPIPGRPVAAPRLRPAGR